MKLQKNTALLVIATGMMTSLPKAEATWNYGRRCSSLEPHGYGSLYRHRNRHRGRATAFDITSDIFTMPISNTFNSLMRQQDSQIAQMQRSSPRYDIAEDEKKFELALDIPGVSVDDISVQVEQDGKVLRITGSRKYEQYGRNFSSEFDQMFNLDKSVVDVENITVKLSNGVLVVTVPKYDKISKDEVKSIPITEANNDEENHVSITTKPNADNEGKAEEGMKEDKEGVERVESDDVDGIQISEEEDI